MTDMPLEERIAEAMIRATTAPAEAGDDAVKNAREEDGTLWHFARVQARAAIHECWKTVNAMIVHGPLQGDGLDKTAERNGLIFAANALIER